MRCFAFILALTISLAAYSRANDLTIVENGKSDDAQLADGGESLMQHQRVSPERMRKRYAVKEN